MSLGEYTSYKINFNIKQYTMESIFKNKTLNSHNITSYAITKSYFRRKYLFVLTGL